VTAYFHPVIMADLLHLCVVLNTLIPSPHQQQIHSTLSEMSHLMVIPMCTIVGLYLVFRQKRPGLITATQRSLGTPYGMPSGDALFSALFATVLFPNHSIVAIVLILSVGAARLIRGYHTVPQFFVGWIFGFAADLNTSSHGIGRWLLFCRCSHGSTST
jgi:hypothetical protein